MALISAFNCKGSNNFESKATTQNDQKSSDIIPVLPEFL